MPAMNTSQAALVDAVLTTHARGYRNPMFVFDRIAPNADVPSRSSRQLKFDKSSFRRLNTRRAPGAPMLTVQYGYAADPVSLAQDALQAVVPDEISEEARRVPGVDIAALSVNMVLDQLDLGHEIDVATMVRNAANYSVNNKLTLTGADKWSDPTSNPGEDIRAAKEAIRAATGATPTRMVLGPAVYNALAEHPKLIERFKYTSADSITTAMMAKLFELDEVVVGKAVYLPDGVADTAPATDIWGNDAVLAHVPNGSNWMVPAFAYTYRLKGYPTVSQPYYEKGRLSWLYPMVVERRPYIVGADAGFLIQGAA
jgi:hypothetical protein